MDDLDDVSSLGSNSRDNVFDMIDKDKQIMLSRIDPHWRKVAELDSPYGIAYENYMKARFPKWPIVD